MSDPDFSKLQAVSHELEELADAGKLTQEDFDRLFADAEAAVGEHMEFLEALLNTAREFGLKLP